MLMVCPECNLQISDKAAFCPHCGYVIKLKNINVKVKARKRLPNGFGQISEIKSGNLRNRFRVMVPAGKTEAGRPISKLLKPKAYFKTYNDAYQALVEYNRSPYDPNRALTFADLYEEWLEKHKDKIENPATVRQYRASFTHLERLHKYQFRDIRSYNIREAIETADVSEQMKDKMKSLCNMLYDYALEREYVDRNYARELSLNINREASESIHSAYTENEMKLLWKHTNHPAVFAQLIQCYTGFRPQELLNIKLEDIDLDQMVIKGGMKTKAGKDRLVPIHPCLQELVKEKYKQSVDEGYTYFIHGIGRQKEKNLPILYDAYAVGLRLFWRDYGNGSKHRPHDGRVQFITLCKKYNVDEYAIKYIVGHQIKDLTERVYTKREIDWLRNEILKIPSGEFLGLKNKKSL